MHKFPKKYIFSTSAWTCFHAQGFWEESLAALRCAMPSWALPMSHSEEPNTLRSARHAGFWAKLVFPRAQHSHTQPHLVL